MLSLSKHSWVGRVLGLLITLAIFALIFQRIPLRTLSAALAAADYPRFLALMFANSVFYFCWDTLVLSVVIRWFHGGVGYRELLPIRGASYVVAVFNTNLARGALAAFLSRRLAAPFLQLGSTVLFLLLTEYTHLVAWATIGILVAGPDVTRELLWIPPAVALFWAVFLGFRAVAMSRRSQISTDAVRDSAWRAAARSLSRTFRLAPPRRYVQTVLLRAPMFFVSLCLHYLAAPAFGVEIPFAQMLAFLPVIFMVAALPITVARLGTTQAAWIVLFGRYAPADRLLAFSLAAHLTFAVTRALIGLVFLPRAYRDLAHRPILAAPTS